MKRFLTALLALMLCFSCAAAQEDTNSSIASYIMPDGAEVFYLPMGEVPQEVPAGLEPMYELMLDVTPRGDVYLVRMPKGHALASVSSVPVERSFTAAELCALWPQIAQDISFDVLSVDSDESCARVETIRGQEMLRIETAITAGTEESPLVLNAECFAFCEDRSVTEVWFLYPAEASFMGDPQLLQEDLKALSDFSGSLLFPGSSVTTLDGAEYADPKGRFSLISPADSTVIDSASTAEAVEEARQRFIAVNPEGADQVFAQLMTYVTDMGSALIFTADMQGMMEISADLAGNMSDFTADDLAALADSLAKSMSQTYDLAVCVDGDERVWISDQEHALMGFWLRMGEMDLQLDLMVCVYQGWLYEVDVYSFEGNQDARLLLHSCVSQQTTYTPPVNGLE